MSIIPYWTIAILALLNPLFVPVVRGVGFELFDPEIQFEIREKNPWCYQSKQCSDKKWTGFCTDPNYGHQSPINLPGNFTSTMPDYIHNFPRKEYIFHGFQIEFVGRTIHVVPQTSVSGKMVKLRWTSQRATYYFHSFHLHWGSRHDIGSEHAIQGLSYPVEVHLVYFHSRYSHINWALLSTEVDAIAVIAVFLTEADADEDPAPSNVLFPLIQELDSLEDRNFRISEEHLNLRDFFPGTQEATAYSYLGSLTTPPCTAIVRWLVFKKPVIIPSSHIQALRETKFFKEGITLNNFRSLQTCKEKVWSSEKSKK